MFAEMKARPDRMYVRLGELACWGMIPQQQQDIAWIIANTFPIGVKFTEAELFDALRAGRGSYPSLLKSTRDVARIFAKFRSLPQDGMGHAGFIFRAFLRYWYES